ncbi:LppA family lipoprotein [Kineosporia sp. NBRC 101731]|uniref:LppA family lipoprotein n=1 Tax=Kineosporia sp. NBRC 101731 TaxID=3032199 RepID=UPI00249FB436|nr:LppA family lipoprotein [Kineosporia sp. NBRC 101731]GLY28104.1 hypothetical protein Kisp02_14690 [Kineosporia sp. NBRC 101731]
MDNIFEQLTQDADERWTSANPLGQLTRRVGAVFLVVGLALTGAGCSGTVRKLVGAPMTQPEARAELEKRPTFEQAEKDYLALAKELRKVFDDLAPELTWDVAKAREIETGGCLSPFAQIDDAEHAWYDAGLATGSAPDAVWPQVWQKIIEVAAQYGFTKIVVIDDEPQNRYLVIKNGQGGNITLMEGGNTTFFVEGACHLHEGPDNRPSKTETAGY